MTRQDAIVIADSSVLVNFLAVDRVDLLTALPCRFVVTNHVAEEITYAYPDRYERFKDSLRSGWIEMISVDDPDEVELFKELTSERRLGNGECSAIAVASHRGYSLAIDDKRAMKRARALDRSLKILSTKDIIIDCIERGILEVHVADAIKAEWERDHKFTLNFVSFQDILLRK